MKPEEKILKVLERIKEKADIAPTGSIIEYRAGRERTDVVYEDEILILNKLAEEGIIEVTNNFGSEYI